MSTAGCPNAQIEVHYPAMAVERSSMEDRVYLRRVQQVFGHATTSIAGTFVAAAIALLIMRDAGVPGARVVIWSALLTCFVALMVVVEAAFARSELTRANASGWLLSRFAAGFAVVAVLGAAPLMSTETARLEHDMVYFMVFAAIASVTIMGNTVMPAYYTLVCLGSMLPLTARFFSEGSPTYAALGATAVIWQVFVLTKALHASRTALDAIVLSEQLRDEIANHESAQDRLRRAATHDALTGLPNRPHLIEHLASCARGRGKYGAVLFLDLDGFKAINDAHGHDAGDRLLQEVARRLSGLLRGSDVVARFGGDEFIVLLDDLKEPEGDSARLAERIIDALAVPVRLSEGLCVEIGASIGIAIFEREVPDPTRPIAAADTAMYEAKARGKNCYVFAPRLTLQAQVGLRSVLSPPPDTEAQDEVADLSA